MPDVRQSFVDSWPCPAILVTDVADSSHLPRLVVTYAPLLKVAFLVQDVYLTQRLFEGRHAIVAVQVPHVQLVGLQRLETGLQTLAEVPCGVSIFLQIGLDNLTRNSWVKLCVYY